MLARLLLASVLPTLLRSQNTKEVCFCNLEKVCPTCPQPSEDPLTDTTIPDNSDGTTGGNNPDSTAGPLGGIPKVCSGGQSTSTVFGGPGSCQGQCVWAPADGFSFCDLPFLFFRDGRWYDWDMCSLCKTINGE